MTPTTDKMQISLQEQLFELQMYLKTLEANINVADQFLAAKPGHKPTVNRYNLLCHNRSETLTKIRKLKERMKTQP